MNAAGKSQHEPPHDRHLSVPAVARRLNRANATIRSMALRGELQSELVAGRIVITRESVEAYEARQGEAAQAS